MGLQIEPPGPAITGGAAAASLTGYGKQTGPTAGTTIASIAAGSFSAGTRYQIDVYLYENGTTASPADDDNMQLTVNNVARLAIPLDGAAALSGQVVKWTFFSPPIDGTHAVIVTAIANATGTAIYHVGIVATPIGD